MKLKLLVVPLMGLSLGMPAAAYAASATETPTPSPSPGGSALSSQWNKLEDEMDRIFRDSMEKLHLAGNKPQQQEFGSSIDIREKGDAYEARVFLPKADADNANVTLKNGTLSIAAGDEKTGRYQESVALPGPVQQDKMKVENKDGFLLVTIPKDKTAAAAPAPALTTTPQTTDQWDQDIVREMQRMQDRMDQLTRDAFANLPDTTGLGIANGELLDSSVKLDDEKDQYVAHFYLPDSNAADFKVNVDNQNDLRLSATSESKNESKGTNATESEYSAGRYEESIKLPGPVHADRMKVERKNGVVTVTLPKA